MPEMHLRQPGFTYSACGPFNKNRERIEKFKETLGLRYIYQNELNKVAFNMKWHMEVLKIYLEEQLLVKYYVVKHLILLTIRNMMNISMEFLEWFINFSIKVCWC